MAQCMSDAQFGLIIPILCVRRTKRPMTTISTMSNPLLLMVALERKELEKS